MAEHPKQPGPDATDAEREEFERDMLRWLGEHRGSKLDARGLEQERDFVEFLSLHPDERKRRMAASTERLRNLVGGDFKIHFDGDDFEITKDGEVIFPTEEG